MLDEIVNAVKDSKTLNLYTTHDTYLKALRKMESACTPSPSSTVSLPEVPADVSETRNTHISLIHSSSMHRPHPRMQIARLSTPELDNEELMHFKNREKSLELLNRTVEIQQEITLWEELMSDKWSYYYGWIINFDFKGTTYEQVTSEVMERVSKLLHEWCALVTDSVPQDFDYKTAIKHIQELTIALNFMQKLSDNSD
ncbi:hypothetical protein JR316_0006808 [Psilocybe cubensis]|uniref:Uncharacterized protein n=2 Tax=Psilocybe cubensis TaxID=181762 RepID=A0ACB8GRX7_PSICU|nr:hypothetical protein JR316_0010219 [Psilocybe cubensis]XP_047747835.1 hypothetical protein JR316_0006808 [Psilocybe cubensis]KAH9477986.1 hypothetical protein JR316_0010219 [Psilocybe cubensis]KAH9480210.1 hypothetical protein JR316_0006808 [Psilocybe cubensis]